MHQPLQLCESRIQNVGGATGNTSSIPLVVRFQIKIANLVIGSKRFANLLTFTWEVVLKATSHAAIFRVCKYAINETDDVLSAKDGLQCASW